LGEIPAINPDISLMLGDAAHNLRTALDHLACELARSVGIAEPMVYFPICENAERYKRESHGKTVGIPQKPKSLSTELVHMDLTIFSGDCMSLTESTSTVSY
jgi:hypothetical protein